MEDNIIYQHINKHAVEDTETAQEGNYRVVRFIGGDKDILKIIKELIKDKYK